jgi:flagellar basal body rod protein FlgG
MSSKDIYASLSGLRANWRLLDAVANNVANVNTVGFKQHRVSFEQVSRGSLPLANSYAKASPTFQDLSDGPVLVDDVDTHVALQGAGFFVLEGAGGAELLTRSGDWQLDREGYLVTANGEKLMGESGAIQIPDNERPIIALDGTVSLQDGTELDRLRVVKAATVKPEGGGRWRAESELEPADQYRVVQGALEGSNVDGIGAMLELIEEGRHFELLQKAIHTSDEMDAKINNTVRG